MKRVCVMWTLFALLATLSYSCSGQDPLPQTIEIATTTSVVNSGLMAALEPLFEQEAGITLRVHAAGSGRALEMLSDGTVDLVISHAPQAESRMLAAHPDWHYRKIATNQFMVVGPPNDAAHVREADDVVDAFTRIATSRAFFVSRGDGSGTHEREQELWSAAKVKPTSGRLLISGSGMATTLRQADARLAYTLSDDATFLQLQPELTLQPVFGSDPRLVNSYAVVFRSAGVAPRFAAWLSEGAGRQAIAGFAIRGAPLFHVWPVGCPRRDPDRCSV